MSEDEKHEFPHWEELYQEREVESMPWFNPELDDDLENALDELGLRDGSALDLGTGPGAQAIELARRGFTVTATDISDLEAARKVKVAFGAVSWGYGTIESLREHFPEEEFDSVSAIRRIA